MSNCFTDMSHPMYGYNKQDKNSNIIVSVTEEIRPCVRWKTKDYLRFIGNLATFEMKDVPEDQVNCNPIKCFNTGTLIVDPKLNPTAGVKAEAGATYRIRSRATNYALGLHFFYLKLPQKGDYKLEVTVSDYRDRDQKNAYTWTYNFHANIPGFYLRTVDFLDVTNLTQKGEGWLPTDQGIVISYKVQFVDRELTYWGGLIGFSSPFIVNDRSELRKFANVLLSCLTNFTHNVSVPATDARCFGRQYDPEQIEITKEITATTTSCNDYWLNPLQSLSQQVLSGVPITDQFSVQHIRYQGKEFGMIYLPDLYFNDCNSITISSDKCECTYLNNIPVSIGTDVGEEEFVLISKQGHLEVATLITSPAINTQGVNVPEVTEDVDLVPGTILIDKRYVGEELLVTYNAEREVELIVANDKRLKGTKFRVIQEVVNTRGIKEYYVFNNVLITENSRDYGTTEEITLSLSLTVSRDENGNFYEIRRRGEDLASY